MRAIRPLGFRASISARAFCARPEQAVFDAYLFLFYHFPTTISMLLEASGRAAALRGRHFPFHAAGHFPFAARKPAAFSHALYFPVIDGIDIPGFLFSTFPSLHYPAIFSNAGQGAFPAFLRVRFLILLFSSHHAFSRRAPRPSDVDWEMVDVSRVTARMGAFTRLHTPARASAANRDMARRGA